VLYPIELRTQSRFNFNPRRVGKSLSDSFDVECIVFYSRVAHDETHAADVQELRRPGIARYLWP
jgi:hypothetical protein